MDRKIKVAGTRSADDVLVAIIGRLKKDLPPNMFNDYQLMQFAEQHVHKMVKFSGSHYTPTPTIDRWTRFAETVPEGPTCNVIFPLSAATSDVRRDLRHIRA